MAKPQPQMRIELKSPADPGESIEMISPYDTDDIVVVRQDGVEVQYLKFGQKIIILPDLVERGPE